MNRFNKTVFSLHRIIGTMIAVFFFMWFFTGLVLVYHKFPRLDNHTTLELAGPLPAENPLPDSLPDALRSLSVSRLHGETVVQWSTSDTAVVCTSQGEALRPVDFTLAAEEAKRWVEGDIVRCDTLFQRDQWIMYSRYLKELPIYKFYFDDPARSQVYVGKESGEVLQVTDRQSRLWSWIGAIPHKLYFPAMRSDVDVWKRWLLAGGIMCLVASLSGIYCAVFILVRRRRKTGRLENPMKGRMMRFHYALGMVFALPLVAWSISGIFSMQKMPKWLVDYHGEEYVSSARLWGRGMLSLQEYHTDYEAIREAFPQMREINYERRGDIPVISVTTPDTFAVLDARHVQPTPLVLSERDALEAVGRLFKNGERMDITILDHHDRHYFSFSGRAPLPVYKIEVADGDGTMFYIEPGTGDVTYLNNNRIARRFFSREIHYLNISPLAGHPTIWRVCMWIICVTGMAFCFSAVWLAVKYIRRKLHRLRR